MQFPNYDVLNDVISGFAKVVVEQCGFHHWIAQRISWGEVVSIFLYLLWFPSYDVINDVKMSDGVCTPGCEPRSVAASFNTFNLYAQHRTIIIRFSVEILIRGCSVLTMGRRACKAFAMALCLSQVCVLSKSKWLNVESQKRCCVIA